MERMTYRGKNGKNYVRHNGYYNKCRLTLDRVADRLAAYEDTGLEPEEVAAIQKLYRAYTKTLDGMSVQHFLDLVQAKQEGRLVVLPCKVGDTVWFRTYAKSGTVDLGVQPHEVVAIRGYVIAKREYTDVGLSPAQYGVSWFLTREEAEAALAKGGEGDGT